MGEEVMSSGRSIRVSNGVPLGHSVIPIVNKLQDIFAKINSPAPIDLPQVVVVGSQSSGKSSVLEALVGRDFLPRGSSICTRCPLVLQLLRTSDDEEWGEFLHLEGRRFFNFSDIRREIQAETDREAGGNKGVSDKQIRLKIFSPNVLDMTLIDLPGITKVPVGDQPSDIETRIRTMIMSYIKRPNCLILAVTPANSDLANSDALQIAGNADPNGSRTIGVITKLDIMDRGTDARNFLLGKVIPLQLGYFGVVNRSQEDILLNRSIKDALAAEEKFFRRCPVYNDLADRCGVPQLGKKLNQLLAKHIKADLPNLKSRISAELVSVRKENASFGYITEGKNNMHLLLTILSKFSEAFSSLVEGKGEEISMSELFGGARIHYIFQNIFVKTLEEVDPCEDLTDEDIRTAIQNATGAKSMLFVPEAPFEILVRRQIARLQDPSLQCTCFVYDELIKMSHKCMGNELQRFPVLRKRMDEVVRNFLEESKQKSETVINNIIDMNIDSINTSHPNFIGGSRAVEIASQQVKSSRIDKLSASDRSPKSRALLSRPANGFVQDQDVQSGAEVERSRTSGASTSSSWGISSVFGMSVREKPISKPFTDRVQSPEHHHSVIHLREPPAVLRPSEVHSDQEPRDIAVTKLLLKSYYDIVRQAIEDQIPKAIMCFLVNHAKRELHNVLISNLYSKSLVEVLLQESEEIAMKKRQTQETLCALEEALTMLDALSLETESVQRGI